MSNNHSIKHNFTNILSLIGNYCCEKFYKIVNVCFVTGYLSNDLTVLNPPITTKALL